jgi:hypothetical protein
MRRQTQHELGPVQALGFGGEPSSVNPLEIFLANLGQFTHGKFSE